ncbi:hypothetical protein HRR83_002413 [Exophiala dermatitidis]|nr:hypothetical protein HRR74_002490 [Exophiala dermatitidis]KAJ4525434.1 hypothetical protein HRR73_002164 [Exophiala dermatitidis]KAJ4536749.1 hypothetical protein HRR76_004776 [Exophiala dermatitidis]KAJ4555648.1 hypothetical protein HRR77_001577 [Exophiala dermatitidis]KAJ4556211.1 hypothetical protein HRR78_001870 [Exophiala dermatitidis]
MHFNTKTHVALMALSLSHFASCSSSSPIPIALSSDSLPFSITKSTTEGDPNYTAPLFPILPFHKYPQNPILTANPDHDWESAYVYNPAALVLNETIFLLYRAQNASKTSSIGLAWSSDGYHFTRLSRPILHATEPWEAGGGTEDPRIVRVNGTFYLTYTAYDLGTPRLCIATSEDLVQWTKHNPLFQSGPGTIFDHSKSGAIITKPSPDGLYHMFFGDSVFYHATSPDLLNWTASSTPFASPLLTWENGLIEPGPPPVKTRDGRWLLIYNAMTTGADGYRATQYSVGQMLLDIENPASSQSSTSLSSASGRMNAEQIPINHNPHSQSHSDSDSDSNKHRYHHTVGLVGKVPSFTDRPFARLETPFLVPTTPEEESGQVDLVVFAEGLVQFRGKWFLYYGQADQSIGVAVADVQ